MDGTTGHAPNGNLDGLEGSSNGTIRIAGWAYDPDDTSQDILLHVYVGGPSISEGGHPYEVRSNHVYRDDVVRVYGDVGYYHGFDLTINVDEVGSQPVYVYAIDEFGETWVTNTFIGSGTANIQNITYGAPMSSGYDRVLPNGDYIIAAAQNPITGPEASPLYYLDIAGSGEAEAGANVQIWAGDNFDSVPADDIWTLTYNSSDKFYTIKQKGSNMCLDVKASSTASGANVQAYTCNGSSAQKWAISRNGRNGYRIQPQCSGGGSTPMSLDIAYSNYASRTNVWMADNNDTNAQSWVLIPYRPSQPINEGRYVLLYTADKSYEVGVAGNSANVPDQADVQLLSGSTSNSRYNSFDFIKLTNGYYKIKHAASGKCLEVAGASRNYKANVSMMTDNGSVAQQWAVESNGSGYSLIARSSGYVLDLPVQITGDGKTIEVYPRWWENNQWINGQRWSFAKAEYRVSYNANGGNNAPSSQTKYYKEDLTLRSNDPTREGYTFMNWNTKPDGTGTTYWGGTKYTANSDVTLYAQWVEGKAVFGFCGTNVLYIEQNDKITFTKNKNLLTTIFDSDCVDVFKYDRNIAKIVIDAPMRLEGNFASAAYVQEMDLENLDVSEITDFSQMFYECSGLTKLNVRNWDTSNVTSMLMMFHGCSSLLNIDFSGWNTSHVTDITAIFFGCSSLQKIDISSWNTSQISSKNASFYNCGNLTALTLGENTLGNNIFEYLPAYNGPWIYRDQGVSASEPLPLGSIRQSDLFTAYTPASMAGTWSVYDTTGNSGFCGTDVKYTVQDGTITFTKEYSFSEAAFKTDCVDVFRNNANITKVVIGDPMELTGNFMSASHVLEMDLEKLDVSGVTNFYQMFDGCSNLERLSVSNWNTDNVISMDSMFAGCTKLANPDVSGWNTANVTDMNWMFYGCTGLTGLDVSDWNTASVLTMNSMFYGCTGLTELDVSAWNTANVISMDSMFAGCTGLSNPDVSGWNTANVTDMNWMFYGCTGLTGLDVSDWNTASVLTMNSMFYGCTGLTELDVSAWNTANVTDMYRMFGGCSNLERLSVSNWNTASVISTDSMFAGCTKLADPDVSGWNTANVTDMNWMFYGCIGLTGLDVSNWDTSSVLTMNSIFYGCTGLTELDVSAWNTANVTDMYRMFGGCSNLERLSVSNWNTASVISTDSMFAGCTKLANPDVSGWNTANVTDMNWMFYGCTGLTGLDVSDWNTANVRTMNSMFYGCAGLTDLNASGWNTANVTDIYSMFYGCSGLTHLDLSGWDTIKVTEMRDVFIGCENLTTLTLGENTLNRNIFTSLPANQEPWTYINQGLSAASPLPLGSIRQCDLFIGYDPAAMAGTWAVYHIPEGTDFDTLMLPSQTEVIGAEAFASNSAEAVIIPAGVTEIGSRAFADCPNLKMIYFENDNNISIAEDFISGSNCDLVIIAHKNSDVAGKIHIYRQYLYP